MPSHCVLLACALAVVCGVASAAFNPSCTAQDIDVASIALHSTDFCTLRTQCINDPDSAALVPATVTLTNGANAPRYCVTVWPCFAAGDIGNAIPVITSPASLDGKVTNKPYERTLAFNCADFLTILDNAVNGEYCTLDSYARYSCASVCTHAYVCVHASISTCVHVQVCARKGGLTTF